MTIALCGAVFGFERVSAAAGGSASLSFTVSPDDLALFSAAGDRMVYPVRPSQPFVSVPAEKSIPCGKYVLL